MTRAGLGQKMTAAERVGAEKPKTPMVPLRDVAQAVVLDMAPPEQRKAVEAYVLKLEKAEVPSFLTQIGKLKKVIDRAYNAGETRVKTEEILKRGAEWVDPDAGVIYKWDGAIGDLFCADPPALKSELLMLDVPEKDVDAAVFIDWKVSFTNLKNIENTALRAIDSKATSPEEKARARRIVETIQIHRDRKPDGPPHLKEKE